MRIIARGKNWDEALAAIKRGGFANHGVWNTNEPIGAPGFVGPTALGYRVAAIGKRPEFWVFTDSGVSIHEWKPTPEEFASREWQVVELAAAVVAA